MVGGKSVEHWLETDTLGLLQQLGVIASSDQMQELTDAELEGASGATINWLVASARDANLFS